MNQKIKKICGDIVKKYIIDKNVLGIMLFGSATRGKFDEYSDIDIYILLRKKGKYSRYNFVKSKYRIDIILDTVKEVNSYFKEDGYNVRRNTSHMLAHGQILYQRTKDIEKVQKIAKKNLKLKTKYIKSEILMHKYSIDDFWGEVQRDIKNENYIAFGIDSQLLLNNIIELFLKLHGEFFRRPSEMQKVLSKLDQKFSKKLEDFYKTKDIKLKVRILSELVGYIYRKTGGPLPQKWVLRN